jgi:hypothetical protein
VYRCREVPRDGGALVISNLLNVPGQYTHSNYYYGHAIWLGAFDVEWIDAHVLCVSGITGTGLVTVDFEGSYTMELVIIVSLIGSRVFCDSLPVKAILRKLGGQIGT